MAKIAFRNEAQKWSTALQFWFTVCIYSQEKDEIRPALKL
jgi:hypothetical protein